MLVFAEHKNVFTVHVSSRVHATGVRVPHIYISFNAQLLCNIFFVVVQCTTSQPYDRWHRQHQCLVVVILSVGFTVHIRCLRCRYCANASCSLFYRIFVSIDSHNFVVHECCETKCLANWEKIFVIYTCSWVENVRETESLSFFFGLESLTVFVWFINFDRYACKSLSIESVDCRNSRTNPT